MSLPATTHEVVLVGPGRLDAIFYVAPRLAEAFQVIRKQVPGLLERDAVVKLVCALYVEDPANWKVKSLPLPMRRNRGAMHALWRWTRDAEPRIWEYLRKAWLDVTCVDLDDHPRFHLEFRRKSHRLLAEAITPCLVKLCVHDV
jgi:hypothetical protein